MRRTISMIFLQLPLVLSIAQDDVSFDPPLKIPLYLSGNFGEIRLDHFHSGIDIKTQGVTGHRVYSVEEGYVSRIKVQTNGYGNSIYITHPNGFTSQYGHLDRYREDIAAYVKSMQYRQQSQTVDLYPGREAFPLEKGELIAYSGNTGGSTGPHLHFELRNSANQNPLNVLNFNHTIKDQVAPRFLSIYIYPLDEESQVNGRREKLTSRIVNDKGTYILPSGTSIEAWGTLGLSVQVFDYMNSTSNRYGIYKLEMYADSRLSYSYLMDEFSFSDTRYVNAHIDYQELSRSGIKAHRLHRLPNDRLTNYDQAAGNRPLEVDEPRDYPIRIVATDVAGNSSELEFTIHGSQANLAVPDPDTGLVIPMKYNQANRFEEGPVRIDIPAYALYQDMEFTFSESPRSEESLSPFYYIASKEVAVHSSYVLSITSPGIDPELRSKLLLVTRNADKEIESAGGAYQDGRVAANLRNFGEYAIALDTVAPQIKLLNKRSENDYSGIMELRFTIFDELSGIKKYEGYIDNHWALFEYDPKNKLLRYRFDPEHIQKGSSHELELYVSDQKENVNLFHISFYW